jgi:hypothetical protein
MPSPDKQISDGSQGRDYDVHLPCNPCVRTAYAMCADGKDFPVQMVEAGRRVIPIF